MSSATIASAPGQHCFEGVKHSGEPTGSIEEIAGVKTYIALPAGDAAAATGGKYAKIILFFADVYSPLFINNKLIQDYFASHGFLVLGIDYFRGDPIQDHNEPNFDRQAWMQKSQDFAAAAIPSWVAEVKAKYGDNETKYFSVGYCFGAPYVMDTGANGTVTAGAIAHPAFLNEDHFKNIKVPLFLSCAEIDHTFQLDKRRVAEDILIANGTGYHFQVFAGVKHGWAVRGDPNIENQRWAKEESAKGIIGWFERWVTAPPYQKLEE